MTALNRAGSRSLQGGADGAGYLRGSHSQLTVELGGYDGYLPPRNVAWNYLGKYDRTLISHINDPSLPAFGRLFTESGFRSEEPREARKPNVDQAITKMFSEYKLVLVREPASCESLMELFCYLLSEEYRIKKLTLSSGIDCESDGGSDYYTLDTVFIKDGQTRKMMFLTDYNLFESTSVMFERLSH